MSDQIEEVIKEIAVKHGITVGRNDPILVLQTINNRLMHDSAKSQQEILTKYKEEMEGIAQRWENEAKSKAERILNASLTASKEMMGKLLQESTSAIASTARKEIESALLHVSETLRDAKKISMLNIAAALITFLAAAAALWATLIH